MTPFKMQANRDAPAHIHSKSQTPPEYSVYIYHHGEARGALPKWEKKHSTFYGDLAVKRAKILYKSDKYAKVEVKKKMFDGRVRQPVDKTYRVFSPQALPRWAIAAMIAAPICMMVGGVLIILLM